VVEESPQTVYPDFTLSRPNSNGGRLAVDIKTTYRKRSFGYTLGSYTSFLRDGKKNILHPYSQYSEHWVIGFVYDRVTPTSQATTPSPTEQALVCPYRNVEWFVQEKYRIAGELPGSGNTANIGSIKGRSLAAFWAGNGPFAEHGEDVFRAYWSHFSSQNGQRKYRSVAEFLELQLL
jgi:hypothetical protein